MVSGFACVFSAFGWVWKGPAVYRTTQEVSKRVLVVCRATFKNTTYSRSAFEAVLYFNVLSGKN